MLTEPLFNYREHKEHDTFEATIYQTEDIYQKIHIGFEYDLVPSGRGTFHRVGIVRLLDKLVVTPDDLMTDLKLVIGDCEILNVYYA